MAKLTAAELRKQFRENASNLAETLNLFSNRKYVVGIDPSLTGTAIVVTKIGKKPEFKIFNVQNCYKRTTRANKTVYQRLYLLRCFLTNILRAFPARLVLIEGYAFNKRQNRELLGEVGNTVRSVMWENPHIVGPSLIVGPTQLKKYILGKGDKKSTKQKVMLGVYKELGLETEDDNEADAAVLAKIGYDLTARVVKGVGGIPTSDADLLGFMKRTTPYGLSRAQWDTVISLVTNKCGEDLYDFFNCEDYFTR